MDHTFPCATCVTRWDDSGTSTSPEPQWCHSPVSAGTTKFSVFVFCEAFPGRARWGSVSRSSTDMRVSASASGKARHG